MIRSWPGRVRQLRDWGQSERYMHQIKGYNFRMDAIQGAVLGVKLPHLDHWNASPQTGRKCL